MCGPRPRRELTREQRQLAEITEMIHTASLVHDDVLDECDLRRGCATVNSKYASPPPLRPPCPRDVRVGPASADG